MDDEKWDKVMARTLKALVVIILILMILASIGGCGSNPYVEGKFVVQIDGWSDWVLQPERPWVEGDESETRVHLQVGLEWDGRLDCPYVETIMVGAWDQMLIGCSKRFGTWSDKRKWGAYLQPALVHQVDGRTSDFLKTNQNQWQGHNPFIHLRAGLELAGAHIAIATGKSLFQGAPLEREEGEPDLYWTNFEAGARFWGKTGAWQQYK